MKKFVLVGSILLTSCQNVPVQDVTQFINTAEKAVCTFLEEIPGEPEFVIATCSVLVGSNTSPTTFKVKLRRSSLTSIKAAPSASSK